MKVVYSQGWLQNSLDVFLFHILMIGANVLEIFPVHHCINDLPKMPFTQLMSAIVL